MQMNVISEGNAGWIDEGILLVVKIDIMTSKFI